MKINEAMAEHGTVTGDDKPTFKGVFDGVYCYTVCYDGVSWNLNLAPELLKQYAGIMIHFQEELKKCPGAKSRISRIKEEYVPRQSNVFKQLEDAIAAMPENPEPLPAIDDTVARMRAAIRNAPWMKVEGKDAEKPK